MQFKTKNGQVLYWLITILFFSTLLTPLVVSSSTVFPFTVGKTIVLRILVEIALIFYLWFLLIERPIKQKKNILFWAVLIFLGILILTTVSSINPYRSLWGNLERMEGVFTIFHVIAVFIILSGLRWSERVWLRFLSFSVVISLIVGFSELLSDKSVFFGSTSFLAVYSLFNIFFAGIILTKFRYWGWRLFGILGVIVNLMIPLAVANRGVIVGLGVAVLVMAVMFSLWSYRRVVRLVALGFIALFVVGVGFIFLLKDSPVVEKLPDAIQRFVKIGVNDPSTQTRLIALGVSVKAFKERPVLGWGPEQFQVAYNKYFNPEYLTYEQAWFDRAHNKVAEVVVNQGIVGLISYLAIFVAAIFSLVKLIRSGGINEQKNFVTVLLIGLIVAYFVQNLFLFDTTVSYLMLFSSLAFMHFLMTQTNAERTHLPAGKAGKDADKRRQDAEIRRRVPGIFAVGIVLAGSIVLIILIFSVNIKVFQVAKLTQAGTRSSIPQDAYTAFNYALAKETYAQPDILKSASQFLLVNNRASSEDREELFSLITNRLEDFLEREPNNAQLALLLGKLYNEGSLMDETMIERVQATLQKVLVLAPLRPEVYTELGLVEFNLNRPDKALQWFQKGIDLNPRNPKAHWDYGLALFIVQKPEEGLVKIEKAIQLGYNWWSIPAEIENLVKIYENLEFYDKLISAYGGLVYLNPQNIEYQFKLAQAYAKAGDKANALKTAQEALRFNSEYDTEIEDFIFNLKQR